MKMDKWKEEWNKLPKKERQRLSYEVHKELSAKRINNFRIYLWSMIVAFTIMVCELMAVVLKIQTFSVSVFIIFVTCPIIAATCSIKLEEIVLNGGVRK